MASSKQWIGAILWGLVEMDLCPDDSIADIFTEAFEKYGLPYYMTNTKPRRIEKNTKEDI